MSTLGQVAFRGNAQAFEYLINRTTKHPLGELRWFARDLKRELDKEIPSLLLRVSDEKSQEYQTYLNRRYENVRKLGRTKVERAPRAEVRLVEFDPESEVKILAGILFQQSHGTWDQALERATESARGRPPEGLRCVRARAQRAAGTRLAERLRTPTCDSKS